MLFAFVQQGLPCSQRGPGRLEIEAHCMQCAVELVRGHVEERHFVWLIASGLGLIRVTQVDPRGIVERNRVRQSFLGELSELLCFVSPEASGDAVEPTSELALAFVVSNQEACGDENCPAMRKSRLPNLTCDVDACASALAAG